MSYQDVRHFYEDPPDDKDLQDKEIKDTKAHLKTLIGVDVDEMVEENKSLKERLGTAIAWLRRLEREYPGCLNEGAIDHHLTEEKL